MIHFVVEYSLPGSDRRMCEDLFGQYASDVLTIFRSRNPDAFDIVVTVVEGL